MSNLKNYLAYENVESPQIKSASKGMNRKEHKRNPKPTTDMIHKRIAFLCMLLPCTLWGQTDRTSPTGRIESCRRKRLANALRRLPGKPSDRSTRHPNPAAYGADRKDILASHAHVPHRQLLPAESACRKCGQGMVSEHRAADHPAGKRVGRSESEHTHSGLLLRFRHSDRLP